jgi:hypothetical protein
LIKDFPKRIGPGFRTGAFCFLGPFIAFSSEACPGFDPRWDTGSREEKASKQRRETGSDPS